MNFETMSITDLISYQKWYQMEVNRMECGSILGNSQYYQFQETLRKINSEIEFRNQGPVEQESLESLPLFA